MRNDAGYPVSIIIPARPVIHRILLFMTAAAATACAGFMIGDSTPYSSVLIGGVIIYSIEHFRAYRWMLAGDSMILKRSIGRYAFRSHRIALRDIDVKMSTPERRRRGLFVRETSATISLAEEGFVDIVFLSQNDSIKAGSRVPIGAALSLCTQLTNAGAASFDCDSVVANYLDRAIFPNSGDDTRSRTLIHCPNRGEAGRLLRHAVVLAFVCLGAAAVGVVLHRAFVNYHLLNIMTREMLGIGFGIALASLAQIPALFRKARADAVLVMENDTIAVDERGSTAMPIADIAFIAVGRSGFCVDDASGMPMPLYEIQVHGCDGRMLRVGLDRSRDRMLECLEQIASALHVGRGMRRGFSADTGLSR